MFNKLAFVAGTAFFLIANLSTAMADVSNVQSLKCTLTRLNPPVFTLILPMGLGPKAINTGVTEDLQPSGADFTFFWITLENQGNELKNVSVRVDGYSTNVSSLDYNVGTAQVSILPSGRDVMITMPSHIDNTPPLKVELNCAPITSAYVVSTNYADVTNAGYMDNAYTNFSDIKDPWFPSNSKSLSDAAAKGFCYQGSGEALTADMAKAAFWDRSAFDGRLLPATDLKVNKDSITWTQPVEDENCIKSHDEDVSIDDDNYTQEVCDQYVANPEPAEVRTLKACQ